jgi:REP-associated tyrosine transposase
MPVRKQVLAPAEYYHVYNRGVDRQLVFFCRDNYAFFLRRLREHLPPEIAVVVAYCLMPNHYHLLVLLRSPRFSDAMQSFGTSYTKAVNKRRERCGPLFQSRFRAIHVDDEAYLLHLSRYIHLNPVPTLVAQPADWEFSSYREYIGVRDGTLPDPSRIVQELGSPSAYRRFVESAQPRSLRGIRHLLIDDADREARLLQEAGLLAGPA